MVLYIKRPDGQFQFSMQLATQIQEGERIKGLPQWVLAHVDADLSIPSLAQRVGMSPRNFSRVFRKEMGMTPATFVEKARIDATRRRLEQSRLPLETISRETGFSSGEQMRRAFARHKGVNPDDYRRGFRAEKVDA